MQHRILRRAIAGLCLVVSPLVARPASAGGAPRTDNPLVNRGLDVIEAVAASDDAGLEELAQDARFDPYDVANTIFVRAIFPTTKPELADRLATAARWAAAVSRFPRGVGLSALVAKWKAYGPDELERERRIVIVPIQMGGAAQRGDLDEVSALAAAADADVVAATSSLNAWGVLFGHAQALASADRLADSGPVYARAAERAEALGSASRAAGCWDKAAGGAFEAGLWAEVRERSERAIAAFLQAGVGEAVANQRNHIASAFLREGRIADARAAAERALVEAESARPAVRPRILANLSTIHAIGGDPDAGGRFLSEALALMTAQSVDRSELLRVRFAYAQTLLESDAWAPALEAFEALATELSSDDASTIRFLVPRSMAILLRALGRQQDALAFARRAHDVAIEINEPSMLDATKSELTLALALVGRHDEAVAVFRASGESRPDPRIEAPAADAVADAAAAARRAIAGYEAAGIPGFAIDVRRNLARLLLAGGRRDEALAELSRISRTAAGDDRSRAAFLTAVALAEAALADRRPDAAVAESRRALRIHRSLARGLSAEDALGTRADAANVADLGLEAAVRWSDADSAARSEAAEAAFELAEASRGLLLAEGLRNPTSVLWSSLSPELVAADRQSRRDLEEARARAMGLSLASVADERGAATERRAGTALRADARRPLIDLVEAQRRRDEMLVRVGREARRVASFVDPAPPDLRALRALLGPTDAFVEFQDAGEAIFAIVVRQRSIATLRLDGGTRVRAEVSAWLRLVSTSGSRDEAAARKVYDAIWRPLEAELAGATRVIVTAEGALAYLPFEALMRGEGMPSEGATGRRLIESLEISYVPSAGIWIALASDKSKATGDHVLAVGDPDLGALSTSFSRLPGGAEEARDVAGRVDAARRSLFVGRDAGVEPVLEALGAAGRRFRVAHFACHGTSDPTSARGTGLILAGGSLLDGDRLARARVPADLVTLSACESARGLEARGEGVLGLARSFFLAGASRVVTSGWLVSDRDGRKLMGDFYDAHLSRGLAASAALRDAKRLTIRRGGESAHPARWATFTLWGLPD